MCDCQSRFNIFLKSMSTENKDKKTEEQKEVPKENGGLKKVKEVQKDAEVLRLLEEDEDDFEEFEDHIICDGVRPVHLLKCIQYFTIMHCVCVHVCVCWCVCWCVCVCVCACMCACVLVLSACRGVQVRSG